jgi:hypothetical protein
MSLVKKPTMTEKEVAANRCNQSLSHGPITAEGKARIGAAQLRHGFHAKAGKSKEMLNMEVDPAMCMKTQENRQNVYSKNVPFYKKVHPMSDNRRKSVGFIGRTCRNCTKHRGEVTPTFWACP